ncbi:hypothetical protein BJ085DRAFT_39623, partial [Dimargaris cristalligena]
MNTSSSKCSLVATARTPIWPPPVPPRALPPRPVLTKAEIVRADARTDLFFLEALPVSPNRFRPAGIIGGVVMENPFNVFYINIIKLAASIREANNIILGELPLKKGSSPIVAPSKLTADALNQDINRPTMRSIYMYWARLQQAVNDLIDNTKGAAKGLTTGGDQVLKI